MRERKRRCLEDMGESGFCVNYFSQIFSYSLLCLFSVKLVRGVVPDFIDVAFCHLVQDFIALVPYADDLKIF